MPDDQPRRLHYFDHQFLNAHDFEEEQNYHLHRRRRHNEYLHKKGVAAGLKLEIKPPTAPTEVEVGTGFAIDGKGNEIVLSQPAHPKIPDAKAGEDHFVTIAYKEAPNVPSTAAGVEGMTRWTEEPEVKIQLEKDISPDSIRLAKLVRQQNSVTGLDENVKEVAGVVAGHALQVEELTLSKRDVPKETWVKMRLAGANHAELTGRLTLEDAVPLVLRHPGAKPPYPGSWRLDISNAYLTFQVLKDGSTKFEDTLQIHQDGQIHTSGPSAEFSFQAVGKRGYAVNPQNGERWRWCATGGNAQLDSGGTKLLVRKDGGLVAGVVDDPEKRKQGDLPPGLSFGLSSGEGIASRRASGAPNEKGLDFYTANKVRLSISKDGNVGIGGPSGGRLTIEDAPPAKSPDAAAVPLVLRKTGAVDKGGLWRLALVDLLGYQGLRFDVNTAKDGDFGTPTEPGFTKALTILAGGQIHVQGPNISGLSFGDRTKPNYEKNPTNGERWVWYADHGKARLWSGGDKLSVEADGSLACKQMKVVIEHPSPDKKTTKNLVHAAIEAPEHVVCYRGEASFEKKDSVTMTIKLPEYFEALTRKENRTVLLTQQRRDEHDYPYLAILVASWVVDGEFTVRWGVPGEKITEFPSAARPLRFSWEVKAVRAGPLLEVEPTKKPE